MPFNNGPYVHCSQIYIFYLYNITEYKINHQKESLKIKKISYKWSNWTQAILVEAIQLFEPFSIGSFIPILLKYLCHWLPIDRYQHL